MIFRCRIDVRRLRALLAAVAIAVVAGIGGAVEVAAAAPSADPLDVTREFYKALHAGNARAAAKLTAADDAEPALRSFVRISKSYRALEAALAERFGADAAEQVGYGRKVQDEVKALLGATAEIEGDTARVAALDGQTITTLRKVKGAWRIELEDALDTAEGRAAFSAQAQATEDASKQVISRVRDGKYATPRVAVDDFEARIARAAAGVRRGTPPQRAAPEPEGTQL